jgi:MoaA/NifB/PqqE/SkfB family radical SAM enzyme
MNKFCIAPWIHVNIWPGGGVSPCCEAICDDQDLNDDPKDYHIFEVLKNTSTLFGSLNENSLSEIWNNQKFKDLRLDMINGKKTNVCTNCYQKEDSGKVSLRQELNNRFQHHFDKVKLTNKDGSFDSVNLVYWDFRFTNSCNFKCRMCGPDLSSSWVSEIKNKFDIDCSVPKLDIDEHWEDIDPLFDIVEEVYFAGGEPLISEEHYKILKKLLQHKKLEIPISYNTNFSTLTYKNIHIFDIWSKFKNLSVYVSVDGIGKRGELIRKGFVWDKFVENILEFKKRVPRANLVITPTVQALNSLHIFDLHKELFNLGIIDNVDQFSFGYVFEPDYLSISILNDKLKEEVCSLTIDHIKNFIIPNNGKSTAKDFVSLIKILKSEDKQYLLPKFLKYNDAIDKIRNENTKLVFPELNSLWQ